MSTTDTLHQARTASADPEPSPFVGRDVVALWRTDRVVPLPSPGPETTDRTTVDGSSEPLERLQRELEETVAAVAAAGLDRQRWTGLGHRVAALVRRADRAVVAGEQHRDTAVASRPPWDSGDAPVALARALGLAHRRVAARLRVTSSAA